MSNSDALGGSHVSSHFYVIATEGNMAIIAETHPVNISTKPDHVENILIGADCSPQEVIGGTALFKEF